jgi:hypothetical protein
MGFGWALLLVVGVFAVVWRGPVLSYVSGKPHLSQELRRFLNKQIKDQCDSKGALLVADDDSWSQDLCGVKFQTPNEFAQDTSRPACVVSIANERRMTPKERAALYSKLAAVPSVLRVRNRLVRPTPDMQDMDDSAERRLVAGSFVFTHA